MAPKEPKLLHFFFGAIGDEFGAMALARFEIAKQKLGPHHAKKLHIATVGACPWLGVGPHLLADLRRLVEEAKKQQRQYLVARTARPGSNPKR